MNTTPWTLPAGAQVLGRVISATGDPLDGAGPLPTIVDATSRSVPPGYGQQLETGIKVIDVFAPISVGSVVGLFSPPGAGKFVLMSELVERNARRYQGAAVLVGNEEHTVEVNDMMRTMREAGVSEHMAMVFARSEDESALREQALHTGWALAEDLAQANRPVLLFIDRQLALEYAAAERRPANQPITVIYFDRQDSAESTGAPTPLRLDTQINLNIELGRQKIWPAVDLGTSRSHLIEAGLASAEHLALVKRAQASLASASDPIAQQVLVFGSQPFYTAELYTGTPGEFVGLAAALADYAALLDGKHADAELESLRFVGRLK